MTGVPMPTDFPQLATIAANLLEAMAAWGVRYRQLTKGGSVASASSRRQYFWAFRMLERQRVERSVQPYVQATASGNLKTLRFYRASYRFGASEALNGEECILRTLLARPEASADANTCSQIAASIERAMALLFAIHEFETPTIGLKRAQARRRRIIGLPTDWRERLAIHIPAHCRRAFLAAALTGCRPSELCLGIRVTLETGPDHARLAFVIAGTKVTELGGQPERRLIWSLHVNALTTLLYNDLLADESVDVNAGVIIKSGFARTLTSAVTRYGRKLWPERPLSAYSLRYQFAADLDRHGASPESIARALGHCATRTQLCYRPDRNRKPRSQERSLAPELIEASRAVRVHEFERERVIARARYQEYVLERSPA